MSQNKIAHNNEGKSHHSKHDAISGVGKSKNQLIDNLEQKFRLTPHILAKILEKMDSLDLDKDYFSQGFQGRVYKIEIETEMGPKYLLILKNRMQSSKGKESRLVEEFSYQSKANDILRENSEISVHFDVPKIRGIINDAHGEQFLIMDYIEGDTLFGHNVRSAIPTVYNILKACIGKDIEQYIENFESILSGSEYGLKKYVIKLFHAFILHGYNTEFFNKYFPLVNIQDFSGEGDKRIEEKINRICSKIRKDYGINSKSSEWIKDKQEASYNIINSLQEHGIYHNDVTSRNIILGNDDKVYLIDFGRATNIPKQQSKLQKSMSSPSQGASYKKYKDHIIEGDYKIIQMIDELQ